jgi:heptose-I-phosphate ethanolaminephosphotransferase
MNNREKIISLLIILSIYIPFSALRNFRTPFDPWFPTKVIKQFIVANKEIRIASILKAGYTHPANCIYPNSQTIVLIIGESAGRKHMHLYGYPRQTTPDMERIHDLNVFADVISSAPTTHKSIGMMLTLADLNNASYTTTVFDIFKAANFKTFWISAQFPKQSPGSGIVPILAQRADSLWSLKQNLSAVHHYDEYVLPRVLEVIDDPAPKKLLVINLLGSHTSYKERIPVHRNNFKFSGPPPATTTFKNFLQHDSIAQIINDYDASIRYTDFVVSNIFKSLEEQSRGAWAAIYLSDHGEEVFDTENRFGHAGSSTSRNVYEIPFVLKISNAYDRWMRDAKILALDTGRPYQTDNLIHTLLNLAAIETVLYDPKKSILHPDFQILPRWIKGSPYTKKQESASAFHLPASGKTNQAPSGS